MKWIIYIVLLVAAALLPERATDVGRLIPVEVIAVSEEAGTIYIETDTGDYGKGKTLSEAVTDMQETASGVIYLDTAEYLILEEGMEAAAKPMEAYLKADVRVCAGKSGMQLDEIGDYLSNHKPEVRLCKVGHNTTLPVISEENGRYHIRVK